MKRHIVSSPKQYDKCNILSYWSVDGEVFYFQDEEESPGIKKSPREPVDKKKIN